jgi:hypothetical protein
MRARVKTTRKSAAFAMPNGQHHGFSRIASQT